VRLVVDASVVVKWFVEEEGQAEAIAILERGDECFAPDLVLVEVAGALDKKFKTGSVTREQAFEAVGKVQSEMTMVAGARLIESALDLASELKHPVADCLYLACALELDARVVSADKTFIDKAHSRGYTARTFMLGDEQKQQIPNLSISQQDLDRIQSVHQRYVAGFENIAALIGQSSPLGYLSWYMPALESPNYRYLDNLLNEIGYQARLDIIASCWLGRGFANQNWVQLRENAASFGDGGLENNYIISKLHHLQLGIEMLKTYVETIEGSTHG
jgi:predicted nucleic acid-binding protein